MSSIDYRDDFKRPVTDGDRLTRRIHELEESLKQNNQLIESLLKEVAQKPAEAEAG